MLDALGNTACGPDGIPAWFLRLAAPILSAPLAHIFNLSVGFSVVPDQWKVSQITPIPKIANPAQPADFRPISVTSIISRQLERLIVNHYLYPSILKPPQDHIFTDQYAFRPTGSTTAALIALLKDISELLESNDYVILISIDFSKAFDSIKHSALFDKLAKFDIDDEVYNWLVSYFNSRKHSTKFQGVTSSFQHIDASVVQGSTLGPVTYSIASSDLKPKHPEFKLHKFADDCNMATGGCNANKITDELQHVEKWAKNNNLQLNRNKTKIMIIRKKHTRGAQPPLLPNSIETVDSLKILGVTLQCDLSFSDHINNILIESNRIIYSINLLRHHGAQQPVLQEVFRARVLSRILYASPAWWGYLLAEDRTRINSFLNKSKKFNLYPADGASFDDLCCSADDRLFHQIVFNHNHVIYHLLPPKKTHEHNLRARTHNFNLPVKTNDKNFFARVLYKNVY